ncbi:MAG TPA: translocation/assembly module TamB domain-containing protein [Candidatus Eisenbacteria bacterium]|nr:translocation/assembly module TamB domain-containing protein [Candidatus Eisenbacteria bacterium]
MTPHEPDIPDTEPRPVAAPEGVVERVEDEVREVHDRIETAVEHVLPRRARMSAGRIAWIILASLLGLVALLVGSGVWYVARHSEWAAGRLTALVNKSLAEHSNLVLEVRDLRGNPFKEVTVIGASVRFRGDAGPPLLTAPTMTLRYAPWDLWFGARRSIEIGVEHPVVRLTRMRNGRLRLPRWISGAAKQGPSRELEVLFAVHDAEVRMPDPADDIVGWSFRGTALSAATDRLVLNQMSWQHGPYASVLQRLQGSIVSGDSVTFHVADLTTPDLHLRATGGWKQGSDVRSVHLEVDRVRWKWLAKAFDNDEFDVSGVGAFVVDARGNHAWAGTAHGSATWDSLPAVADSRFDYKDGRVVLTQLHLTSPAGALTGTVDYDSQHLDIRGDVTHGHPEHWRVIGLDGWPEGDLNGRFHYASAKRKPAGSRFDARLASSEIAGWHGDSAWVWVNAPSTAPDTFSVRFDRRGGEALLGGRIDDRGWRGQWSAREFPLDEWPDGRASGLTGRLTQGSGTIASHDSALTATGDMSGTATDWLGIHAASWHLAGVSGRLLPAPDLAMPDLRLRDLTFLGVHFDSAAAGLQVGDSQAALEHIVAQAGDTTLATAGRATWRTGGWAVELDRAEARSSQFHWVAEPPVRLAGDETGTDFQRFVAHDSTAHLAISGRWALPATAGHAGGSYDWAARAEGLNLARLGLPAAWALEGSASAELRVTGRSGDPRWTLVGSVLAPGAQGRRVDSASVDLEGARRTLEVRRFETRLGRGGVHGRLSFSGMAADWPDTLTGDGVSRWLGSAASWQGEVRADSLPLDRVVAVVPQAEGWSGVASGTLAIAGRPAAPELTLQTTAQPISYVDITADRIDASARYHGGSLEVTKLTATRGGITSTASGAMALQLAWGSPPGVPDRPMHWRVDLDHADLGLLAVFVPQIGEASGALELHAGIEGTPRHPRLTGDAHIRDGTARLAGREEQVADLNADLHFEGEKAVLDKLTAHQLMYGPAAHATRKGLVTASGTVDLTGMQLRDYQFKLGLHDFTVTEQGFYEVNFDADPLTVTRGTELVNGHSLPHVTGQVAVRRAVVLFDFANQSETSMLAASTAPLQWTYAVGVRAASGVHWQPPDADIEFSADLTLEQTARALNIFGDLTGIRGYYDFLGNRFTISKANLSFDNIGGVNPLIDAEATTRVVPLQTTATVTTESTVPHTVTVDITGRADHPSIQFSTEPADWDQAVVLRELTVGHVLTESGAATASSLQDPLDSWLTRKINEQLTPLLSTAFLQDIGQLQLQREQGGLVYGKGDIYAVWSKQLNPRVQLTAQQRVPGFQNAPTTYLDTNVPVTSVERNVQAEYRLNRFFYVTTELGQRRTITNTTASTAPDFNVNLHARWEY